MCNTNNCPSGIATQKPELRNNLNVEEAVNRLNRYFDSSVKLMQVMARACGHTHLNQFNHEDITTWCKQMADLTSIKFAGNSESE